MYRRRSFAKMKSLNLKSSTFTSICNTLSTIRIRTYKNGIGEKVQLKSIGKLHSKSSVIQSIAFSKRHHAIILKKDIDCFDFCCTHKKHNINNTPFFLAKISMGYFLFKGLCDDW